MATFMVAWGIPKPSLAQVEFFGARGIRTNGSGRFELIDLDGDDQLDAVVLQAFNKIATYKGFSDGTFSLIEEQEIGQYPNKITSADFDGDGDTDVAVSLFNENSIVVYLSNGDGSLTESDRVSIDGIIERGLVAGDIDGDGDVDIVVSRRQEPAIVIFANTGNGQFEIMTQIEIPYYSVQDIAMGDLDGDGDLDLVAETGSSIGDLTLFFNAGNGTFEKRTTTNVEGETFILNLSDLDFDGDLDLLITSIYGSLFVMQNNGDGVFETVQDISIRSRHSQPAIGDIDSDGDMDLIVNSNISLEVLTNDGNNIFSEPFMLQAGLSERYNPSQNKLADLNGDGYLDIVSSNNKSKRLSTLLNLGDGTFPSIQLIDPPTFPSAAAWSDLDRDGLPDLITHDRATDKLIIRYGRGSGYLETPVELPIQAGYSQIIAADLNNDQLADLCMPSRSGGVTVMLNQGTRIFSDPVNYLEGRRIGPLIVDDFDGDGFRDVVFAQGETITLLPNNGGGAFFDERSFEKNAGSDALVAADFNGDGSLDLAYANQSSDSLSIILNDGKGGFSQPTRLNLSGYTNQLSADDLNGDGLADLVVTVWDQEAFIRVLFNQGDLTFEVATNLQGARARAKLVLSDIDDDGHLDIILHDVELDDVTIFLNTAIGEYADPILYAVRASSYGLMVVDTDGDLDKDISLLPRRFGGVDVLRNMAADDDDDGIPNELDPDDDNDGSLDEVDKCPKISATTPDGCPSSCFDRDTDGFCDVDDNCPSDFNPSQIDTDSDGVGDSCDACPNDADKSEPGICGCGVADDDADNDGVLNCVDNCQNTPTGTTVDDNGCPLEPAPSQPVPSLDDDGDGVQNENDDCPNTDPSLTVNGAGCPADLPSSQPLPDSDGDGITDDIDLCANTADGVEIDSDGCAIVDTTDDTANDLSSTLRSLCGSVGITGWIAMLAGLVAIRTSRRKNLR